MKNSVLRVFPVWVAISAAMISTVAASDSAKTPEQLFEERILPIFKSDDPSSCTECHLSGVDLKNYLLPSAEKSFANLRDLGLIDLKAPEKSKILKFISMSPDSDDYQAPGAKRIDPAVRKAELEAFSAWITAAAADPKFRDAPALAKAELAAPAFPAEVIRHGRTDRLLASYEKNIWALRFRCAGCHMPGGAKFKKHADKHGFEKMAWLRARGPAESMRILMAGDLVNVEAPEKSELILKPLDEAEEEHGGGIKMRVGDTDYFAFLSWIRDYANVVNSTYTKAEDLPGGPEMTGTEIWLRVTGLPKSMTNQKVLLAVHSPTDRDKPVAVSSTTVLHRPKVGVTLVNGFLMRRSGDEEPLSPGKYFVRLYRAGNLTEIEASVFNWEQAIKSSTLLLSGELTTDWQPGFKNATVVEHQALRPAGGRK